MSVLRILALILGSSETWPTIIWVNDVSSKNTGIDLPWNGKSLLKSISKCKADTSCKVYNLPLRRVTKRT